MRAYRRKRHHASTLAVVPALAALWLFPASASAQQTDRALSPASTAGSDISKAVATGAPAAYASSRASESYIYTSDFNSTSPQQITGTLQMSAVDATAGDIANSGDRATVAATFNYPPGGSQYTVQFTGLEPVGTDFTHFGGVGILQSMFGSTSIGGLIYREQLRM